MLKDGTVFILGAGASKEYGFPVGKEYRLTVIDALMNNSTDEYKALVAMDCQTTQMSKCGTCFRSSGVDSIDRWLERQKNEHFQHVGKAAIATVLCKRENESKFFMLEKPVEGGWYQVLYNAMLRDAMDLDRFADNPLCVITFNYDRSLEQFLYTRLANTFPDAEKAAVTRAVEGFTIIHMYGSLGRLPWQSGNRDTTSYDSSNLAPNKLTIAMQAITLVGETQGSDDSTSVLLDAKKLCFLGFGFDTTNLQRLFFHYKENHEGEWPQIYGTTLGLTSQRLSEIQWVIGVGNRGRTYVTN